MAGHVHDNTIAVCVQVEGYDFDRLSTDVTFSDNGTNVQTTSLPIPEPLEVIREL